MKTLRYALYFLLLLAGLVLAYLGSAALLSRLHTHPVPPCSQPGDTIYVHSSGVHIEIIFPDSALPSPLKQGIQHDRKDRYTSFGWGEKAFYTEAHEWDSLSIKGALKAAFIPTPALLRVRGYLRRSATWRQLIICDSQMNALFEFIQNTFVKDENGQKILFRPFHYGPSDYFYAAKGHYWLFYTCNTWANKAFKKAGIPTAIWTPFESGIIRHLPASPPAKALHPAKRRT